jgi:hypothetical protein
MRAIGDPDYVYRPWSKRRRAEASARDLARRGTPPNCRKVYGVIVPDALAPLIAKEAAKFRHQHKQDWHTTRAFVLWAVGFFGGLAQP